MSARATGVLPRRAAVLAALLAAASLAAGCSPSQAGDGPPVAENPPAPGDRSAKPEVVAPEQVGDQLVVEDLVLGSGPSARAGDTLTAHIVTVSASTGAEIDSTWELAAPRRIPLVEGGAVPGFLEGVTGMQVGGRRYIVVPSELAYGATGAPPAVSPGEDLVFVVDVLSIDVARG